MNPMQEKLQELRQEALEAVKAAADTQSLEDLEKSFLGKKGALTAMLKGIKDLSVDEKKVVGKMTNDIKKEFEAALEQRAQELKASQYDDLGKAFFDTSLPGKKPNVGRLHPLTKFIQEIEDTFLAMNFDVAEGPEIEDDYHNFTALNIPEDHPARDMQDTLWAKDIPYLLRTHTSPVQVRYMEANEPPIRIICPGRVFRKDDVDATHSPMFHQFEGLMIGTNVTMAHLKGILNIALKRLIDPDIELRFRTSFFPFVEPGMEVDVKSSFHRSGWLELLGCGMVHPNVLRSAGYDPEKVQGFAFGAGIERLLMIKHKINDIRLFYENDPRFLEQFPLA
jgi:phenylalanyl-tRNA synthetase alpha chain